MSGISRLLFVSALAVVAFVVALFSFKEVPASECQGAGQENSAYHVGLEPTPDVNLTVYSLNVQHNGRSVMGARVCMRADMGGSGNMSGMGTSNVAREVSPGKYEIPIRFEMGGHWQGQALISEQGKETIKVPIELEVK
jgi:hypothetical protein